MAWRGWLTVVALVAASAASLSAHATVAPCGPTHVAQDDADSGADAPDAPGDALVVHPQPHADGDRVEDYYWAWLDLNGMAPTADANDWYAFDTNGAPSTLMVGVILTNVSMALPQGTYAFEVRLFAPDGSLAGSTTNYDENVSIPDAPAGTWLVQLRSYGGDACSPSAPTLGDPLGAARNHGLYVGCKPVCVDEASLAIG